MHNPPFGAYAGPNVPGRLSGHMAGHAGASQNFAAYGYDENLLFDPNDVAYDDADLGPEDWAMDAAQFGDYMPPESSGQYAGGFPVSEDFGSCSISVYPTSLSMLTRC